MTISNAKISDSKSISEFFTLLSKNPPKFISEYIINNRRYNKMGPTPSNITTTTSTITASSNGGRGYPQTPQESIINSRFTCSPREKELTLRSLSSCGTFKYKTHDCRGYCPSWSYSNQIFVSDTENSNGNESPEYITTRTCCRIEKIIYNNNTKIKCSRKPSTNTFEFVDFYDNSNVKTIELKWHYYVDDNPLYEGYFEFKYPISVTCSCQQVD